MLLLSVSDDAADRAASETKRGVRHGQQPSEADVSGISRILRVYVAGRRNVRDLRGRDVSNLLGFDESKAGKLSGELLKRGVHTTSRGTWYVSCMHTEKEIDRTVDQLAESLPKLIGN